MSLVTCPDRTALERLVSGALDASMESELAEHLEHCPACRRRLEELSSASQVLPSPSPDTDARGHAQTEAALRQVVSQLEREGPPRQDEADPRDEDDWRSLLAPGEGPASLGRLGDYEILEVLGRGGMGIVFRARDAKLGRIVALKALSPHVAAAPSFRKRFLGEARAAAAISHPHVVTIFSVEEVDGLPLIAMELIRGRSLAQRIRQEGALGVAEILRIGSQAAQALAAAHAQGLVHRDIKPDNILLENGVERVKLADFGLARALDEPGVTQSGAVIGTPQYMSPEQAQGAPADARSDLFCLGCVLYAMAAGQSPFRGGNTLETLHKVLDADPPPLRSVRPDAPAELEALVARLLEKKPDRRPASAAEVADALTAMLAEWQKQGPRPPAPRVRKPRPAARPRRWSVALALVLLIGLLGAGEAAGVTRLGEALATIFRIATPTGTLVIEASDPGVTITVDGEEVRIATPGQHELRLKPGRHNLQVQGDEGKMASEIVTISRGQSQLARVWFEPNGQPKISTGDKPEVTVIKRIELGAEPETITRDGVAIDDGALKLSAGEATTFRLYAIPFDALDDSLLTYRAKLKSEGLEGKAYLEMWVRLPGKGEFFSRALWNPLTGTTGWDAYETPFLLQKGEVADQVKLNVVVEGKGTVWIKEIELLRAPLPQEMRAPG